METRKNFGYTASIVKDTNRLIASSQANWAALPIGSYIIFDDEEDFYKVSDKETFFLIKSFEKVEDDRILIDENLGVKINLNDSLKLTFKQYEAIDVKIKKSGSGFKVGDILTVKGGVCKKDLFNDLMLFCELKVTEVDEDGGIEQLSVASKGAYLEAPEDLHSFDSAEIEVTFSDLEKRILQEVLLLNGLKTNPSS